MKQGITKKKFCISIDSELYDKILDECDKTDAKLSTKINTILKKHFDKKVKR